MSKSLNAIELAEQFVQNVGAQEERKRQRYVDAQLPLVLLDLSDVVADVVDTDLSERFDAVAQPVLSLLKEYDPNPGKTHSSRDWILDYKPDLAIDSCDV